MKEIIINSRSHGIKKVLVDDNDFELVNKFKWFLSVGRRGNFYAYTNKNRKKVSMHRMVMDEHSKVTHIDHLDSDGLNNQKHNLRRCSNQQNHFNMSSSKGGTSKYKGVYFDKSRNKWAAEITLSGKKIYLGRFDNETLAAVKYNTAAIKYFGEFANLNSISR
jgi:hypothetical protein